MKRKLKVHQMQINIQDAVLNEIEHAKMFLLIQEEDIELIKKRLKILSSNQQQELVTE
ncbi:hypothetical protein ACFS5N_12865 [Mucilaginibacter ximonensis]|uniref:Uncharacterized protein n=1 Tax=Mucilaginibacter ximonensis TaxID=538021 RepID=A0ABW5YDU5_9SPHI